MKVNINQTLKQADGKSPVEVEKGKALTLKDVCINAILTPAQDDDEKKKWEKYEIFKKLRDGVLEVELMAEEIVVIKKGVARVNPPLIMGQAFEMLEGK